MLKMIIADDEYIVRDGLKTIIPWEQYGIEVIAEAVDGQEALDLCRELKPDILFTDIRMPMLDGLEVAMELQEQNSGIKIIIISGVQDFNYAKTALSVNAEGYILKPVKIPELKEVITKVVNGINLEREKKFELENLQDQLERNLPVIREKFMRNWILGVYKSEAEIASNLEYLHISLDAGEGIVIAVLQIDDYYNTVRDMSENDKQLLFLSMTNLAEDVLNAYNAGVCSLINDNEFIVVFNRDFVRDNRHMDICGEITKNMAKFMGVSVSAGIGRIVYDLLHANISYKEAQTALQYSFYTGKNSLLSINDIDNINNLSEESIGRKDILYSNLYELENRIINTMKLGNVETVESCMNELFERINAVGNLPVDYVQNICLEMVYAASRAAYDLNESFDDIVSGRFDLLNSIQKSVSIFELQKFLKSVFVKAAAYFSKKYNQKNNKVIARIKDTIRQRYRENIGISSISDEIYLSPNYISHIFREETGETITQYITKVRMEKAKELLRSSDVKILEIAEYLGFENAHYFSTVFKKYTGIHPQKFRANAPDEE
ncbi:MAG TPA: response regulator [Clostridia bacterium]|nr:response regulator [Clostridia bacterium]